MASIPSFDITENGIVVAISCRKKDFTPVYLPELTQIIANCEFELATLIGGSSMV